MTPPDAAPVAWRYRYSSLEEWKYVERENECNPHSCYERQALYAAPSSPAQADGSKCIRIKWVEEKAFGYHKAMRVTESHHPRFIVGSRFDYGFLDIATMEGYETRIDAVSPEIQIVVEQARNQK